MVSFFKVQQAFNYSNNVHQLTRKFSILILFLILFILVLCNSVMNYIDWSIAKQNLSHYFEERFSYNNNNNNFKSPFQNIYHKL